MKGNRLLRRLFVPLMVGAALLVLVLILTGGEYAGTDWQGEYFNNPNLSGTPTLRREESALQFDWGTGSPDPRIPADGYSARWRRVWYFDNASYTFSAQTDDGVRLYVDGGLVIDAWHDQIPTLYTVDLSLRAGWHELIVEYYENTGEASASLWWWRIPSTETNSEWWLGAYYSNVSLYGPPALVRHDAEIDFDWGETSPDKRIAADSFSVRWMRALVLEAGQYEFTVETDDGLRLYVDDRLLIDEWRDGARRGFSASVWLPNGEHIVRVEYYEHTGQATVKLSWRGPLEMPTGGNLITCVGLRDSWIKVYQLQADGTWLDVNPHGWGAMDTTGYLKIDGLQVDYLHFGANGHPYRVELWSQGRLIRSVGNLDNGQPEFLIRAEADNYTPWQCSEL